MECIIVEDERLSRDVLKRMIEKHERLELVGEFEDAITAMEYLAVNSPELIFLDIELNEESGFDILTSLNYTPHIIITTSHKKYAYEGFEYSVDGFLLKPFTVPKFLQTVGKIDFTKQEESRKKDTLFVRMDSSWVAVKHEDISFIEAFGDYVKIFTTSSKRFVVRARMKVIETALPQSQFVRVHRSYIVSISQIHRIHDEVIEMVEGTLPIGKKHREDLLKRVNKL